VFLSSLFKIYVSVSSLKGIKEKDKGVNFRTYLNLLAFILFLLSIICF